MTGAARETSVEHLVNRIFPGTGEMAERCRAFDWAATPLGPVEQWPQSLRTSAQLTLASIFPTIILWGPELVQIYNEGYRPILGVKHPAGLGQPTHECWPEVRHINGPIFDRVLQGETLTFEDALYPLLRSGVLEDAWFTLVFAPIVAESGDVAGAFVTVVETTSARAAHALQAEREMLERQISVERNRLADIFHQAPSFLTVLRGPEHAFEFVNEAFFAIIGQRDLIGKPAGDVLPEAREQGLIALLDGVLSTGVPYVGRELSFAFARTPGGVVEQHYIDFVYQAITEADGTRSGVVAHGSDVTEQVVARREIERLLAVSEHARTDAESAHQKAESVLQSIADPFILLDNEWRITYVNDAAPSVLQTTREALLGRILWDVFTGALDTPLAAGSLETMATGRPTSIEAFYAPLDAWLDVHTYRWAEGLMVHFRNVSLRKAGEAEREVLLADAKAANRAKADFLGVMSHELRTPLNAIGGYAELIEMGVHGPVTPEQRTALERIQRSQRHLLGLINGVLNYAKLDAGVVSYDLADVPLDELLFTSVALTTPQLRAKHLDFRFDGCDPRLTARADGEKTQQVVLNLLSNAIKFTDAGGRITLTCGASDNGLVTVRVADTGHGISASQFERVFQPFIQVDVTLTRAKDGAGLGLAISRDLARGMGGDLTLESEVGVGSTFTLTLPSS